MSKRTRGIFVNVQELMVFLYLRDYKFTCVVRKSHAGYVFSRDLPYVPINAEAIEKGDILWRLHYQENNPSYHDIGNRIHKY